MLAISAYESTDISWRMKLFIRLPFLVEIFETFASPKLWLLSFSWLHLGLSTGFWLGPYATTLIFTDSLSKFKTLIPFYACSVGLGEVVCKLNFSILVPQYDHLNATICCFHTFIFICSLFSPFMLIAVYRSQHFFHNRKKIESSHSLSSWNKPAPFVSMSSCCINHIGTNLAKVLEMIKNRLCR